MSLGFRCVLLMVVVAGAFWAYRERERQLAVWLGLSPPPAAVPALPPDRSVLADTIDLGARVVVKLEGTVSSPRAAPRAPGPAGPSWNAPGLYAGEDSVVWLDLEPEPAELEGPALSGEEDRPGARIGTGLEEPPLEIPQDELEGETSHAPAAAGSGEPPPATYTVHRVVAGDKLWNLAERYLGAGHRASVIFEWNRDVLERDDLLPVGTELKIPAAR